MSDPTLRDLSTSERDRTTLAKPHPGSSGGVRAVTRDGEGAQSGDYAVLGPPHCEDHLTHHIGCLDCAAEVCAADDLDLPEFFDELERIGWRNFRDRVWR